MDSQLKVFICSFIIAVTCVFTSNIGISTMAICMAIMAHSMKN